MLNLQAVITLKDIGVSVYQTTLIWPLAGLFQTLGPPLIRAKGGKAEYFIYPTIKMGNDISPFIVFHLFVLFSF